MHRFVWSDPRYAPFFTGADTLLKEWHREVRWKHVSAVERCRSRLVERAALSGAADPDHEYLGGDSTKNQSISE